MVGISPGISDDNDIIRKVREGLRRRPLWNYEIGHILLTAGSIDSPSLAVFSFSLSRNRTLCITTAPIVVEIHTAVKLWIIFVWKPWKGQARVYIRVNAGQRN